jgi:hypothetical protein
LVKQIIGLDNVLGKNKELFSVAVGWLNIPRMLKLTINMKAWEPDLLKTESNN